MKYKHLFILVLFFFGPIFCQCQDPKSSSLEGLLTLVISDLLSNDKFKDHRDFYGTKGDASLILVNTSNSIPWPAITSKTMADWTIVHHKGYNGPILKYDKKTGDVIWENFSTTDKKLAARFDSISSLGKQYQYSVGITLFNGGGSRNGSVIGGSTYTYLCILEKSGWKISSKEAPVK